MNVIDVQAVGYCGPMQSAGSMYFSIGGREGFALQYLMHCSMRTLYDVLLC